MNQEAFWNARYESAGEDYLFGITPNRFLERRADLIRTGQNALSVADGEGRNSVWLAEQGLAVVAIEFSSIAIAKAKKLAAGRGVQVDFQLADMLNPAWPPANLHNRFDWVVGIFIQFAGPNDRPHQMAALKQLTKPGGRVLLQGYTPKQLAYRTGGPSTIENLYTRELLEHLFADWKIEELVEYEEHINEGIGHHGQSALIGLIARKPA